jgi:5-methylcytosine-specific restriction endonuclease McrA
MHAIRISVHPNPEQGNVRNRINQSNKTCVYSTWIILVTKKKNKVKRKNFSSRQRLKIYRKTEGHCYLCGDLVDFDSFEIEHKVPISKGGTNDLSNLFCSCHCCNTIKHDIYPEDFMEKIIKIFMYQMKICNRDSTKWKIICNELNRMI